MKIRIAQEGYGSFSGFLGTTEFIDGVSVDDVSRAEINMLSTLLSVVEVDTDKQIGILYDYDAAASRPMAIEVPLMTTEQSNELFPAPEVEEVALVDEDDEPEQLSGYSQANLEAIADKNGIAGLRVIADPLNIKGTSIQKLIEGILAAQGGSFIPAVGA